jgi:hypothetical protein
MKELTKKQINESISTTWAKLEQAVQQELDKVLAGESELTASTTTAVVKFIEASKEISRDYVSESEAWAAQVDKITGGKPETLALPTFDDEGEVTYSPVNNNAKPKANRKK